MNRNKNNTSINLVIKKEQKRLNDSYNGYIFIFFKAFRDRNPIKYEYIINKCSIFLIFILNLCFDFAYMPTTPIFSKLNLLNR